MPPSRAFANIMPSPTSEQREDAHIVTERIDLHVQPLHVGPERLADALGGVVGILAHEGDRLLGERLERSRDLLRLGLGPLERVLEEPGKILASASGRLGGVDDVGELTDTCRRRSGRDPCGLRP
jgi:hypothetical protein